MADRPKLRSRWKLEGELRDAGLTEQLKRRSTTLSNSKLGAKQRSERPPIPTKRTGRGELTSREQPKLDQQELRSSGGTGRRPSEGAAGTRDGGGGRQEGGGWRRRVADDGQRPPAVASRPWRELALPQNKSQYAIC
jgi:hypothetical protein